MRCEVWDGEVGALTARLSAWCHVRRGGTLSTGIRVSRGAKAVKRKRAGELNSLACQIHISRAVFLQCCVPETRKSDAKRTRPMRTHSLKNIRL